MAGDRREIRPETMARPGGHYSHAVVGGGLVFVAGQLPIAPDGSLLNEASFEAQATQTLANVAAALRSPLASPIWSVPAHWTGWRRPGRQRRPPLRRFG